MKNFQFSELLSFVTRNVLLFAYSNSVNTINDYFTKNAPKNELLNKMVFRFSDTLMTEKQKVDTLQTVLGNGNELPTLKSGSLQLVYNDYFKNNILLVNNTFALMCNVSTLTTPESKAAYNETLLNLFLHLATPQTVTVDSKQIANMLFVNSAYPIGKQYINSLKYLSSDVQNAFIELNDSFAPCKVETTFFKFDTKVETVKSVTPKNDTVKNDTPKVEPSVSVTPKKSVLTAIQKMQIVYDAEKLRMVTLPKSKANVSATKVFESKTVEMVVNELHQKSDLSTASLNAFLNAEIAKYSK